MLVYQASPVEGEFFFYETTKAFLSGFFFATRVMTAFMSVKSLSSNNKPNWIGDVGDNEGNDESSEGMNYLNNSRSLDLNYLPF